jgi:hypothetical protein
MTKKIAKGSSAVASKPDTAVAVGVVGTMPVHFDALRKALAAVNASADMSEAAMRRDVATVTAALVSTLGDKALPPRNRGRFTGLRTYDFQNTLFAVNDRAGWRFSDRTLAVAWAVELASNRCDFIVHADYVGSTRTAYTRGRHGSNVIDLTNFASHVWPAPKAAKAKKTATATVPAADDAPNAGEEVTGDA